MDWTRWPRSRPQTLALALLALTLLGPSVSQALTVSTGSVQAGPKGAGRVSLSGQVPGLSLEGVASVRIDVGAFSQVIPIERFGVEGSRFTYTGVRGDLGVGRLVLDPGAGTFEVAGTNIALAGVSNPVPVRLQAGAFDQCSMPQFQEAVRRRVLTDLTFQAGTQPQFACAIADVPLASPTGFLVNTPTSVRVQARVSPATPLDPGSAQLLRVDESLAPLGAPLCSLTDDGNLGNGDDLAGDRVFSCLAGFQEPSPARIRLLVVASVAGAAVRSPSFFLNAVTPLTPDDANTVVSGQQAAAQIWQQAQAQFGDTGTARAHAVAQIGTLPGVRDAGVSVDKTTIWIDYESGVGAGLLLNPPGSKGGLPAPAGRAAATPGAGPAGNGRGDGASPEPAAFTRHPFAWPGRAAPLAPAGNIPIENSRVLVWDPYNDQFPTEGTGYRDTFQNSKCPKFQVTYLAGAQADVASVSTFAQYGTVVLSTHGAVDGNGQVVFLTRETASLGAILAHVIDLILGDVMILGDVFAIRPGFIQGLSGGFPNSLVYNSSCQSAANSTMANAFIGKGAKTYFGYTKVVNGNYAESAGDQLLDGLLAQLQNTGDAFAAVSPKVDPVAPNAVFVRRGAADLAYSGEFRNGGFETGDLTGWTRAGDGRVLGALGEFAPPEGAFLGLISTGLGFTTSSGTIEQSFCLPEGAATLHFNWNFSSEEFTEYCGTIFDDAFRVELVTDGGANVVFSRSVNGLCGGSLSPTGLAFDQSGPGCQLGSGNDCKVWSTGWQAADVDISAIAAANEGKGVILRLSSTDVGDSIFDSAILLDDIRLTVLGLIAPAEP